MKMKKFKKIPLKRRILYALLYMMMPFAWLIDNILKAFTYLFTKRKAALSCVLAAAMMVTMLPNLAFTASAAEITVTQPSGSGTEGSPYQIATVENLYWFAGLVNGTLDGITKNERAYAVLTQDIVVNENLFSKISIPENDDAFKATVNSGVTLKEWTPIGSSAYYATFDGQGHTISGLYCERTDIYTGFFGYLSKDAIVKNLGIANSYISSSASYVGAICGSGQIWYTRSVAEYTKIENCFSKDNYILGAKYVGGIAGGSPSIVNCYNTSKVSGYQNVGGITGGVQVLIENCYNTGAVTGHLYLQGSTSAGTSTYKVGGIAGNLGYYSWTPIDDKTYNIYGNIKNCLNTGAIKCYREGVGAICGNKSKGSSAITNSYYLYHCVTKNIIDDGVGVIGGNSYGEELIATQIRSGMVCYNLNNGVTDGTQVWYQTINGSNFPTFEGKTVYRGKTYCTNDFYSYANSELGDGHLVVYSAEWDDGHFNCTKTATCSRCKETLGTETVHSMVYTIDAPTCTSQGYSYYGANFTTPGFTQEKYYFYPSARGHSAYPPTYVLSSDKTQMTASVKCSTCGVILETETAAATKKVVTASTCTQDGTNTYTANFTNTTYFDSTKVLTETASATGHTYVDGFCTSCGEIDPSYMSPNANGYYEIDSVVKLKWFAAYVNMGNAGVKGLLTADLSLDNTFSRIGTNANPYSGTFEGNGHTISVNYTVTTEFVGGLFDYVNGATIKNINITGSINTTNQYVGGLVSYEPDNVGAVTLENILSSVNITSSYSGTSACIGGILALANSQVTMTNCGYTGTISAPNSRYCSGLVGISNLKTTLNNCYMTGKISQSATNYLATFGYKNNGSVILNNCYYLNGYGTEQGTQKTAAQFQSGEVTYLLNGGKTDGTQAWYQTCGTGLPALSGATVYYGYTSCASTGRTYSNSKLSETILAHTYIDAICTNCGEADPAYMSPNADGYYEIDNVVKLKWFAAYVNTRNAGAKGLLTANIDMVNQAWNSMSSFGGTLDGGGHTISNLNKGGVGSVQQSFIRNLAAGGVVKNLCFDGATSWFHASGRSNAIIAEINNGTIQMCRVSNSYVTCGNYGNLGGIAAINNGVIKDCGISDTTLTRIWSGVSRNSACIAEINNGVVESCYSYNCSFGSGVIKGGIVATGNAPVNSFYSLSTQSAAQSSTMDGTAKTAEQFESGEVTYLLNSGKTDGTQSWYQTCGTGLPVFSGDTVYYGYKNCGAIEKTYNNFSGADTIPEHTDENTDNICDDCGAELTVISVTITWGAMEFTYTDASEGTWNPTTCTYENKTDAGWTCDADANKITVASESNVDLTALFSYEQTEGVSVNGSFTNGTTPVTDALPLAKETDAAQTVVVYLKLDGKPDDTANKFVMGTVTVTIGD